MFFQLGVIILGSTVSLTSDEVNEIIKSFPHNLSLEVIAIHNMKVSVFNFVPFFGIFWTGSSGFDTGVAMKGIAIREQGSATHLFFTIAAYPHYWSENFAYSIALTAGSMLFLALLTLKRSTIFHEVKCLIASLTPWAALLVLAAFLEVIPQVIAFMLWVIIIPLIASVLELITEDSFGHSKKATLLMTLLLYLALFCPFFSPRLPYYLFPIAIYISLGYYLFEALSNSWLRRKTQFSLSKKKTL